MELAKILVLQRAPRSSFRVTFILTPSIWGIFRLGCIAHNLSLTTKVQHTSDHNQTRDLRESKRPAINLYQLEERSDFPWGPAGSTLRDSEVQSLNVT